MTFVKKRVIETFDEELLKVGTVVLVKPSLKAMHYGIVAQVEGDKLYYTYLSFNFNLSIFIFYSM